MSRPFVCQRFYDWLAPVYGFAQRLLPMWRRYTEQLLPCLPATGSVLEIGPGPGVLLEKIAGRYPRAVGLDLSAGMLHQAQHRLRRAHRYTRLVQGDTTHLPFPTSSLDSIATTFALSAVPDGLAAVQEMARVLRPGGILALVDAGYPSDGNLAGTALARLWELGGDFMRDEATLMQQAGLQVVELREFGAFDHIRLVVGCKSCTPPPSRSAAVV
jgi:ubiquinone/menaquinone biosynthesis C-methylase UbiE